MNKRILTVASVLMLASVTLVGCANAEQKEPAPTLDPKVKENVKPLEKQTPEEKAFLNNAYNIYQSNDNPDGKWTKFTAAEALTWGNDVCVNLADGEKIEDITVDADVYKMQLAASAQEILCP